jgi:FKBP-type peptidyl-prolyl cis-trans isomerase
VGGTRRAIVPPSLAYGSAGNPPIPPNAALVFDISLTNIQ